MVKMKQNNDYENMKLNPTLKKLYEEIEKEAKKSGANSIYLIIQLLEKLEITTFDKVLDFASDKSKLRRLLFENLPFEKDVSMAVDYLFNFLQKFIKDQSIITTRKISSSTFTNSLNATVNFGQEVVIDGLKYPGLNQFIITPEQFEALKSADEHCLVLESIPFNNPACTCSPILKKAFEDMTVAELRRLLEKEGDISTMLKKLVGYQNANTIAMLEKTLLSSLNCYTQGVIRNIVVSSPETYTNPEWYDKVREEKQPFVVANLITLTNGILNPTTKKSGYELVFGKIDEHGKTALRNIPRGQNHAREYNRFIKMAADGVTLPECRRGLHIPCDDPLNTIKVASAPKTHKLTPAQRLFRQI